MCTCACVCARCMYKVRVFVCVCVCVIIILLFFLQSSMVSMDQPSTPRTANASLLLIKQHDVVFPVYFLSDSIFGVCGWKP